MPGLSGLSNQSCERSLTGVSDAPFEPVWVLLIVSSKAVGFLGAGAPPDKSVTEHGEALG